MHPNVYSITYKFKHINLVERLTNRKIMLMWDNYMPNSVLGLTGLSDEDIILLKLSIPPNDIKIFHTYAAA